MVFPPAFDAAWDDTFPPDTQQANQLGADIRNFKRDIRERHALLSGTLANRPSNMDASFGGAGYGATYFATDTGQNFQWNGAAWSDVTQVLGAPGTIVLPGLTYPAIYTRVVGIGNTDMYTVPVNRRALILHTVGYNDSGATAQVFINIKIAGSYYKLATANGYLNNSFISKTPVNYYTAEAGETFAVNTDQQPISFRLKIMEFDTSSFLKSIKFIAFTGGNDTIYTVPGGKTAFILGENFKSDVGNFALDYYNGTAGALNVTSYAVPNGSAISSANKCRDLASVAPGGISGASGSGISFLPALNLAAGDFVVMNTGSAAAGQFAWFNVVEK